MYPAWVDNSHGNSNPAFGIPELNAGPTISKPTHGLSTTIKFAKFFGFCPINLYTLKTQWIVSMLAWLLLIAQIPLCIDIALNLINKTENLVFFSDYTVTAILHLTVALHGTLFMLLNVFQTGKWRSLIQSLRQQPNMNLTEECHQSETNTCYYSVGISTCGCAMYLGFLIYTMSQAKKMMMGFLSLQHFIILTSLMTPVLIFLVVTQHLRLHFRVAQLSFDHKVQSTQMKKFTIAQARELSAYYMRISTALEAMNDVFSGYLVIGLAGWISSGTFVSYLLLESGVPMGAEAIHVLWLVAVQQASCLFMFVKGSKLNYESRLLKKQILMTSVEKYDDLAKETIDRLVQYIDEPDWGLSVGGFFHLDTSTIMTIMSLIFSHTLFLVEMGVYSDDTDERTEKRLEKLIEAGATRTNNSN